MAVHMSCAVDDALVAASNPVRATDELLLPCSSPDKGVIHAACRTLSLRLSAGSAEVVAVCDIVTTWCASLPADISTIEWTLWTVSRVLCTAARVSVDHSWEAVCRAVDALASAVLRHRAASPAVVCCPSTAVAGAFSLARRVCAMAGGRRLPASAVDMCLRALADEPHNSFVCGRTWRKVLALARTLAENRPIEWMNVAPAILQSGSRRPPFDACAAVGLENGVVLRGTLCRAWLVLALRAASALAAGESTSTLHPAVKAALATAASAGGRAGLIGLLVEDDADFIATMRASLAFTATPFSRTAPEVPPVRWAAHPLPPALWPSSLLEGLCTFAGEQAATTLMIDWLLDAQGPAFLEVLLAHLRTVSGDPSPSCYWAKYTGTCHTLSAVRASVEKCAKLGLLPYDAQPLLRRLRCVPDDPT